VELDFEPVKDVPLDPKCYRLWRRKAIGRVLSASRALPGQKS